MLGSNRMYQFAIRCLIAAILLLPRELVAEEKSQPSEPQAQTQPQTHQQPAIVSDVTILRSLFNEAVKIFTAEKAANEDTERRKERREQDDLYAQNVMAAASIMIAVFTFIQIIVGGITLYFLWRTFTENRRTANAAIKAAEAAEKSVEVTSDTAERQLRAYVTMKNCIVEFENNRIIKIKIVVKNTGQTPALKIHCVNKIRVGLPESFNITADLEPDINTVAAGDLGAGIEFTNDYSIGPIDHEVWNGVQNRSVPVFVWGEYRYWDIFKRERRYTRYRMTLHPTDNELSPYPGGNEIT